MFDIKYSKNVSFVLKPCSQILPKLKVKLQYGTTQTIFSYSYIETSISQSLPPAGNKVSHCQYGKQADPQREEKPLYNSAPLSPDKKPTNFITRNKD